MGSVLAVLSVCVVLVLLLGQERDAGVSFAALASGEAAESGTDKDGMGAT